MITARKLIIISFLYLIASAALSILYLEVRNADWFARHVGWTYLVWSFQGPLSAAEYAWHGLAPVWRQLSIFLAGGLVILPFLSMPICFRGRAAARLCGLGVLLWVAFAALVFGTSDLEAQVNRLIAIAADFR